MHLSDKRMESLRIGAVILGILGITLAHYFIPSSLILWHNIFQRLYYLPIIFAAISFGWLGGTAASLFTAVCYIPHIIIAWRSFPGYVYNQYAEIVVFFLVGLITGLLADRERKHKLKLENTATQLATVYRELQESFEHLKRSDRMAAIGHLSAGLAHEIRNPLASIEGSAAILEQAQVSEEQRLEFFAIIKKECQRLNQLLTNLLDFARPRTPRRERLDIGKLLDSVIGLTIHTAQKSKIVIHKEIPAAGISWHCDSEQLKQVILNLILNAIQAMPEGGDIVLEARPHGDKLSIQVVDQGCGIKPEDMDKVFDPFYTTKDSGTGLGLAVAFQIVNQLGGTLTHRANQDKGMTFSLILPVRTEKDS
jgi:two-component system, NtrC family, sensor histidine kinase HydH